MPDKSEHPYASRGGLKLEAALTAFGIDPTDKTCVDLGCSTGGFVSCWLHHGAAKVYAVDTAYGELAWTLRQDKRVVVMERSNALHVEVPTDAMVDFASLDLGWTKQDKALPAALRWLANNPNGEIISLVKPHYEKPAPVSHKKGRKREVVTLTDEEGETISREAVEKLLPELGLELKGLIPSPIKGGKGGNLEFLAWLGKAK